MKSVETAFKTRSLRIVIFPRVVGDFGNEFCFNIMSIFLPITILITLVVDSTSVYLGLCKSFKFKMKSLADYVLADAILIQRRPPIPPTIIK